MYSVYRQLRLGTVEEYLIQTRAGTGREGFLEKVISKLRLKG